MQGAGASKLRLRVRVHSDVACPWCYVGKRRLDAALRTWDQRGGAPVDVQWLPFMIDKRTRAEGEEYLAYNERRWGSDSWTVNLRRAGRPDGAMFADWRIWPNTFKAHQLVRLAEAEGGIAMGAAAKEALFLCTYELGGNVSLDADLVDIGDSIGLERARVAAALAHREHAAEVEALDTAAKRELGISGVPHFHVSADCPSSDVVSAGIDGGSDVAASNPYTLSGAQSTQKLLQAFDRVVSESLQQCEHEEA